MKGSKHCMGEGHKRESIQCAIAVLVDVATWRALIHTRKAHTHKRKYTHINASSYTPYTHAEKCIYTKQIQAHTQNRKQIHKRESAYTQRQAHTQTRKYIHTKTSIYIQIEAHLHKRK
jgi:hypothetical protein